MGYIQISLALGLTRTQIIKKVKDLEYKKNYAEKLVDETIKYYKKMLEGNTGLRIAGKPVPAKKGVFGKPGSREAKPGRPSTEYKLEEVPTIKPNERLTELGWVIGLLSGSYIRLIKLAIRWMHEDPILRGLAIEALSRVVKSTDALEKSFKEALPEDSEKLIDDWYSEIMEPIWREIPSILSSNLPITGDPKEIFSG